MRRQRAHASSNDRRAARWGVRIGIATLPASLAIVATGAVGSVAGPTLARYPYLTDLTASSVDVNWATSASDTTPGVVTYGVGGNCTQYVATTAVGPSSYTAFAETSPYYQHSVLLKNLAPATTYCYRVYTGTNSPGTALLPEPPVPPTTFTTPPAPGSADSFSFDVLGDFGETSTVTTSPATGTFNSYQAALDAQLAASATSAINPALFAVSTGDIAYNNGSTTNYGDLNHPADTAGVVDQSNIFDPRYWGKVGSTLPLFSTAGNHGRTGTFFSTWPEPTTSSGGVYSANSQSYPAVDGQAAGTYPSDWYAFTVGTARIYILDADWTDVAQGGVNASLGLGCPGGATLACPSYQVERDEHWQQSSAEYNWLASDLAQDESARGVSAMRLVFFHYPLRVDQNNFTTQQDVYLQNSARNPNGGASSLEALLANNNVNLVFNGHAHMYERNVAPLGGVPNYVTGGGGAVLTNVSATSTCSPTDGYARGWDPTHAVGSSCGAPSDGSAAKPAAVAQVYHFLKVTVSGSDVTVVPTDSTGTAFDPMTYHFVADSQAPSQPGAPAVARGTGSASYNVTVTRGTNSTDNVGVVSYDIYRDGIYQETIPAATQKWTEVAVPAGTHTWTVAARDQRGNASAPSIPSPPVSLTDTTPPTAPTLTAAPVRANEIDLAWSGATDNVAVTGYDIYRDGASTPAASGVTTTTWADTGLVAGSTHSYVAVARDAAGLSSPNSNTATATVAAVVPVFQDGFESGSLAPGIWTTPTPGLVVQQAIVHAGNSAAEETSTGAATWSAAQLPTTYPALRASAWVYVNSRSTSAGFLKLRTSTGAYIAYLYVNAAGFLSVRNDAGGVTHVSTTPVTNGQWHKVEYYLNTNPGGPITITAAIDGTNVTFTTPVTSTETLGSTPIGQIVLGDTVTARTYDVAIDDVTVTTS